MSAFLNLGHDPLQRQTPLGNELLDTRESHDRLPSLLTQWLRTSNDPTLWVITGPGSFSAMRSASVAIAMLSYHDPRLRTLCLDKKTLYHYLFNKKFIDAPCYIYTGQIKSVTRLSMHDEILYAHQIQRTGVVLEHNARTDCLPDPSRRHIRYIFDMVPFLEGNGILRDIHHLFVPKPVIPSYRDIHV